MNYNNRLEVIALAEACREDFDRLKKDKRWFYTWINAGENWKIVGDLYQLAIAMKNTGREFYSMGNLIGALRYHTDLREAPLVDENLLTPTDHAEADGPLKLNSNISSFIARMLMKGSPELENFFRLRDAYEIDFDHG